MDRVTSDSASGAMQLAHDDAGPQPLEDVALEAIRYDAGTGLVPVVVQDVRDKAVLMVAYANREALKRTLGTGKAWFWSRSREAYWLKGETSGHVLQVEEVRLDCDGDTVLYLVSAAGPACHTGARSCFFRRIPVPAGNVAAAEGMGEPADVPVAVADIAVDQSANLSGDVAKNTSSHTDAGDWTQTLMALWKVVEQRFNERPAGAYTTYLFEQGIDKMAKKVGEEAVEVAIAAKNTEAGQPQGRRELLNESADLLYHLLVLWQAAGIHPGDVGAILADRSR